MLYTQYVAYAYTIPLKRLRAHVKVEAQTFSCLVLSVKPRPEALTELE